MDFMVSSGDIVVVGAVVAVDYMVVWDFVAVAIRSHCNKSPS